MPIPIIDASQALKASPEKTEDALLKVHTHWLLFWSVLKYIYDNLNNTFIPPDWELFVQESWNEEIPPGTGVQTAAGHRDHHHTTGVYTNLSLPNSFYTRSHTTLINLIVFCLADDRKGLREGAGPPEFPEELWDGSRPGGRQDSREPDQRCQELKNSEDCKLLRMRTLDHPAIPTSKHLSPL